MHKYDEKRWKELFSTLTNNEELENSDFKLVPMKELEEKE